MNTFGNRKESGFIQIYKSMKSADFERSWIAKPVKNSDFTLIPCLTALCVSKTAVSTLPYQLLTHSSYLINIQQ